MGWSGLFRLPIAALCLILGAELYALTWCQKLTLHVFAPNQATEGRLAQGEPVVMTVTGQAELVQGYFLGRVVRPNLHGLRDQPYYLVYDPAARRIIISDEAQTRFLGEGRLQPENIYSVARIKKQQGMTCLPNAVLNCFEEFQLLYPRHPVTPELRRLNVDTLFNELKNTLSNETAMRNAATQLAALRETLTRYNIPFSVARDLDQVKSHLGCGGIAILGTNIEGGVQRYFDAREGGTGERELIVPRPDARGRWGHAVVAIGLIRETGGRDKLVILESANPLQRDADTGLVTLWDPQDLRQNERPYILINPAAARGIQTEPAPSRPRLIIPD